MDHSVKNTKNCICMSCGISKDLWLCLECGYLGCGRYNGGHALAHYHKSLHFWVLNITTHQIWDYHLSELLDPNLYNAVKTFISIQNQPGCRCAVCYHNQKPKLCTLNVCMDCGFVGSLWVCLSCNYVGCGRFESMHAYEHFKNTNHAKVLSTLNFSVWDYKEDKYLHRHDINTLAIKSGLQFDFMKYFEQRIQNVDDDWRTVCSLKETYRQMTLVEQRLIKLYEEKKELEAQISQHDMTLNDMVNQLQEARMCSTRAPTTFPTDDKDIGEESDDDSDDDIAETSLFSNWSERCSFATSKLRVGQPQMISIVIMLVFYQFFIYLCQM